MYLLISVTYQFYQSSYVILPAQTFILSVYQPKSMTCQLTNPIMGFVILPSQQYDIALPCLIIRHGSLPIKPSHFKFTSLTLFVNLPVQPWDMSVYQFSHETCQFISPTLRHVIYQSNPVTCQFTSRTLFVILPVQQCDWWNWNLKLNCQTLKLTT